MRNLIIFIVKHHFPILFVILEIISILLIVQYNYFQRASFANSSNSITGSLYKEYSEITAYFSLRSTNNKLAEENARLRGMMKSAYIMNDTKKYMHNDSIVTRKYEYLSARVISNSTNKQRNFLTIDKGSIYGIKPDMAVISSNGIVGVVKEVSPNFSTVISILHREVAVSAKMKGTNNAGMLTWTGKESQIMVLHDISTHVKAYIGDTVVTSGYSAMYPEGMIIGKVVDMKIPPAENFYIIYVKLIEDISDLKYVYVVNNYFKSEQSDLEKKTRENDENSHK